MKIYISALVGATGQTILGGFIDAFRMPLNETKRLLEKIGNNMTPVEVSIIKLSDGVRVDVFYPEFKPIKAADMIRYVENTCDSLGLGVGKEFSLSLIKDMIDSYVSITGQDRENIVIESIGTPKSLVYIVGLGYIYEKGKFNHADIICSDINVGGGQANFNGQFYYVPTPLVKKFIDGYDWKFSKTGEMLDPLGACIIKNLSSSQQDSFLNGRVGIGYSNKSFEGVPGRTRIVISN